MYPSIKNMPWGGNMHIQLKMEGVLQKRLPDNAGCYHVDEGSTVLELIHALGLTPEDVVLVFVGDRPACLETPLVAGKTVSFYPMLCGG